MVVAGSVVGWSALTRARAFLFLFGMVCEDLSEVFFEERCWREVSFLKSSLPMHGFHFLNLVAAGFLHISLYWWIILCLHFESLFCFLIDAAFRRNLHRSVLETSVFEITINTLTYFESKFCSTCKPDVVFDVWMH